MSQWRIWLSDRMTGRLVDYRSLSFDYWLTLIDYKCETTSYYQAWSRLISFSVSRTTKLIRLIHEMIAQRTRYLHRVTKMWYDVAIWTKKYYFFGSLDVWTGCLDDPLTPDRWLLTLDCRLLTGNWGTLLVDWPLWTADCIELSRLISQIHRLAWSCQIKLVGLSCRPIDSQDHVCLRPHQLGRRHCSVSLSRGSL